MRQEKTVHKDHRACLAHKETRAVPETTESQGSLARWEGPGRGDPLGPEGYRDSRDCQVRGFKTSGKPVKEFTSMDSTYFF